MLPVDGALHDLGVNNLAVAGESNVFCLSSSELPTSGGSRRLWSPEEDFSNRTLEQH